MTPTQSKPNRSISARRVAAGFLVLAGFAIAAASPALADRKHHHWKHNHGNDSHYTYVDRDYYYYGPPDVIYVQPRPVYVRPAPVYYEPAPVIYPRPSINLVFPLFD